MPDSCARVNVGVGAIRPHPHHRAVLRRGIRKAALCAVALLLGCGPQVTPSSTPATIAPSADPAPTSYADTLRVGFVPGDLERSFGLYVGFRQASDIINAGTIVPRNVVHAALYRYDERYQAAPDLADGPCEPRGEDGRVIRCRIVATTFHDGTPVTADDVAYTYRVFLAGTTFLPAATGKLTEVRVVDARTVDFLLSARDPTFLTESLQVIPILPRHTVEAAYAAFAARTAGLQATALTALADAIDDGIARDPKVCSPRVEEGAAMLEQIGVTLYREDFSHPPTGNLDACAYLAVASGFIRQAAAAMSLTGLRAVAAAWQLLSIDWHPIGAGPYRFVSEDAGGIHLEAWSGYHGGQAATRFLDFVATSADGAGVEGGTVDIHQRVTLDPGYLATASAHGIRILTPPDVGYIGLHFNVRAGRLFADRALRLALQQCISLVRDVDAATAGSGGPIYSPFLRGSWAYEPDLPKPDRNLAAARAGIEAAGWRLEADGIYARDGVRLRADILVRGGTHERVRIADLIAKEARDCGMDLRASPEAFTDLLAMLRQFPHLAPGGDQPFDLYIGGFTTAIDPGSSIGVASWQVTTAERPDSPNFMGFEDPVVDRLVERGMATYDQVERERIYRALQRELAAELPILYLWSGERDDLVRAAVATVDGPLDVEAANWASRPERMLVALPGT